MKLVTVATHSDRYFSLFMESLKRNKVDYKILGWKQKWKGFSWRFSLLYDYIKTLPDNEIILFTDAFDCILLTNLDEIEQKFKSMKTEFVISSEIHHKPVSNYISNKIYKKCNNCYLNAGMYIGYVHKIKQILHDLLTKYVKKHNDDDQELFTKYCNKHKMTIDTKQQLFLNYNPLVHDIKFIIKNKRIYIPKYNTYPCIYGFPASYPILNNNCTILKELGYKCIQQNNSKNLADIKSIIKRIISLLPYFKLELFILLCVILVLIIIYLPLN